jgi:hypothetical protein
MLVLGTHGNGTSGCVLWIVQWFCIMLVAYLRQSIVGVQDSTEPLDSCSFDEGNPSILPSTIVMLGLVTYFNWVTFVDV